jgi:phospholipase/lecithinase/hemolysin
MKLKIPTLVIVAAALVLAIPTLSASPRAPYSAIVVFGTSLSDSGNAFALAGGTSTPPDYGLSAFLIPGAPYARGGHHLSNGATWVEQFARSIGLAGSVQPAYRSESAGATNYAVGTARACDGANDQNVNLADQVSAYLNDVGGVAPADALYVIEMGANDLRDALAPALAIIQQGGSPEQALQAVAPILLCAQQAIQAQITALYIAGARNFLVWTVPDPGLTPAIRSLGPVAMQAASFLTSSFNNEILLPTLQGLAAALPGLDVTILDAFALLHQMNAMPANFGLTNTTSACVVPDQAPYFCQNPDEYLFWDGIHPTRAAHAAVAREAARVLAQ